MEWADCDKFTQAYIEAALWSSTDDNGEPLDREHDQFDLAPETLRRMADDCRQFQSENEAHLAEDNRSQTRVQGECSMEESAGHDFWLTRCGHGAGFWDGDWQEPSASALTESARKFGCAYLYVGDDGKVYQG